MVRKWKLRAKGHLDMTNKNSNSSSILPEDESNDPSHIVREGKSATLDVGTVGNDRASFREAMDPANQSLGEALRLSYRLLRLDFNHFGHIPLVNSKRCNSVKVLTFEMHFGR